MDHTRASQQYTYVAMYTPVLRALQPWSGSHHVLAAQSASVRTVPCQMMSGTILDPSLHHPTLYAVSTKNIQIHAVPANVKTSVHMNTDSFGFLRHLKHKFPKYIRYVQIFAYVCI